MLNLFANSFYTECICSFIHLLFSGRVKYSATFWQHFFLPCNAQPFEELCVTWHDCHIFFTACTFYKTKKKFSSVLCGQWIYFALSIRGSNVCTICSKALQLWSRIGFPCVFIDNTNFSARVLQLQGRYLQDTVWTESCFGLLSQTDCLL